MAVKWTIRELTPEEYPGTQLQYGVFDETGKMVSAHHEESDAQQMAAFPRMLEALQRMVKYPEAADGTEAEVEYKADLAFAKAALAAAKEE